MVLRTIAVPDPAPGTDWRYVVPGNWLIDLQSVTASLYTTGGTAPVGPIDASGHGHTGTYTATDGLTFGVPGLFAGNAAIRLSAETIPINSQVTYPGAAFSNLAAYTIIWWQGPADLFELNFDGGTSPGLAINTGTTAWAINLGGALITSGTYTDPGPPATPRMVAWRNTGTDLYLYVNGVQVVHFGPYVNPAQTLPTNYWPTSTPGLLPGTDSLGTLDEWAAWSTALSPAAILNLYNLSGTYNSYANAVLAAGPDSYYHLDELPTSGAGRTPNLEVTNGAQVLGDYPGGFPASGFGVPQQWTWVVGLNSNGQTPGATATTAGLPRLILPAGYTLGTNTPDLLAGDQWSDITIWWDDAYQNSLAGVDAYAYPPGAKLVYHQIGT